MGTDKKAAWQENQRLLSTVFDRVAAIFRRTVTPAALAAVPQSAEVVSVQICQHGKRVVPGFCPPWLSVSVFHA